MADEEQATSALSGAAETESTETTTEESTETAETTETEGGDQSEAAETETTTDEVEPLTAESFTFPEGVEVSEELMTPFLGIVNDADLSPAERAQKIVDLQIESTQKSVEAANEAAQSLWNTTQEQWYTDMQALPEIGGDKLDESLADIKAGLVKAGATQATFDALDVTGAGNHPEMVRILHALTKPLKEGSPVSGAPAKGKLSQAEKMFGS